MNACPAELNPRDRYEMYGPTLICGSPAEHRDADGIYRCGRHCDEARARYASTAAKREATRAANNIARNRRVKAMMGGK